MTFPDREICAESVPFGQILCRDIIEACHREGGFSAFDFVADRLSAGLGLWLGRSSGCGGQRRRLDTGRCGRAVNGAACDTGDIDGLYGTGRKGTGGG